MLTNVIWMACGIAYLVAVIYLAIRLCKSIAHTVTVFTIDANRWIIEDKKAKKPKDLETIPALLVVGLSAFEVLFFCWLAHGGFELLDKYLHILLSAAD